MLYLLYNHNLVGFTRKKDKQKGWYIYYWTLLPDSIRFSYFKMKKKLLDRLKEQLNEESGELFFVCPNDCVRLNFDRAMDFEFHCPECGDLINQDDGQEKIDKLKKQIIRIEKEVTKLQEAREIRRKKVKKVKKEVKAKKKASVKKKTTTKKTKKSSKKKSDVKKKKSGKKISKKEVKKKVITKRKEKK